MLWQVKISVEDSPRPGKGRNGTQNNCFTRSGHNIYGSRVEEPELKDYNECIERGCKGYTFSDYQEKEVRMGTLTLRADMDLKAQKLYETYREIPTKISIDKLRNIFSEEMKRIVPENRIKRTNTFNREGD